MRVCWTFRLERLFPLSGPQFPRPFTVFAVELFGHSDERAENDGAIIVRQFDNAGFDDEPASSIRWRVRFRRSICHVRMSVLAFAA